MLFFNAGLNHIYKSVKIDKSFITPSRSATVNSKDDNLNTYDTVNLNTFEYRWTGSSRKFTKSTITMTVRKPSNLIIQFYYIPPGITNPASYINYGSYTCTGNITNHQVGREIPGNWVYADGVYIIHISGGSTYARLQEVDFHEKK
jgi:hypothetical protein